MAQDNTTDADAYYGDDEADEEMDLSFLDDQEDENKEKKTK